LTQKVILFEKKIFTVLSTNLGHSRKFRAINILNQKLATDRLRMKQKWRIVGCAAVGVDPRCMGIGPIPTIKKVLKETGYAIRDMELFEIKEAFAAASNVVERELGPPIMLWEWNIRTKKTGDFKNG
jgi:acetyl-CoA acetyltransferase